MKRIAIAGSDVAVLLTISPEVRASASELSGSPIPKGIHHFYHPVIMRVGSSFVRAIAKGAIASDRLRFNNTEVLEQNNDASGFWNLSDELAVYRIGEFTDGKKPAFRLTEVSPMTFYGGIVATEYHSRFETPPLNDDALDVLGLYLGPSISSSGLDVLNSHLNGSKPKAIVAQLALDRTTAYGSEGLDKVASLLESARECTSTVGITSVSSLLKCGVELSTEGSWEDRINRLRSWYCNPRQGPAGSTLEAFASLRYVIVRISTRAAILCSKEGGAVSIEAWTESPLTNYAVQQGHFIGFTAHLTAAACLQIGEGPDSRVDLGNAIKIGLGWTKALAESGLGDVVENSFARRHVWDKPLFKVQVKESNAKAIKVPREGEWTIAAQVLREISGFNDDEAQMLRAAVEIGMVILKEGVKVAYDKYRFPVAIFASAVVVDHREFTQLSEMRSTMIRYLDGNPGDVKPLCFAVFGKPGGGKSFAIKELAKSMQHKRLQQDPVEANLSQFSDLKNLARVFHETRDVALAGKVPLVLIDEFDSAFHDAPFGWLRYFLMPMQDGKFQDGEAVFHLGRAIMIFIGGVNESFDAMEGRLMNEAFRLAKGPDFVSRLRGFLNVRGVVGDKDDFSFILRRAVMMRGWFERYHRHCLSAGVLDISETLGGGLLTVSDFKHGARSLEAIISMLRVAEGEMRFDTRSLPASDQLEMHVSVRKLELAMANFR